MDMGSVAEMIAALAAIATVLVPIGAAFGLWLNRPYANLQRALSVYRDLPPGKERSAWEQIVAIESWRLRARLARRGMPSIVIGAGLLVLGVNAGVSAFALPTLGEPEGSLMPLLPLVLAQAVAGVTVGPMLVALGRWQRQWTTQDVAKASAESPAAGDDA